MLHMIKGDEITKKKGREEGRSFIILLLSLLLLLIAQLLFRAERNLLGKGLILILKTRNCSQHHKVLLCIDENNILVYYGNHWIRVLSCQKLDRTLYSTHLNSEREGHVCVVVVE